MFDLDEHPLIRNKGLLLDRTLRITSKMDNPISLKLQDSIEHPGGSKDWFGMAEHVITTVCALGEHQDALCPSKFLCDQHHRLLFKILDPSKDPNIRSNIVIALGDVVISFRNVVVENSKDLYKVLSDGVW